MSRLIPASVLYLPAGTPPLRLLLAENVEVRQQRVAAVENDIPFEYKQDCYREFGWSGQTAARYVRLKALHNGHPGGWIFTDEIIVE